MTFLVHSMTQKNLSRKESPAMSIPFKTMMGTAYIALAINFSETGKKKLPKTAAANRSKALRRR